MAKKITPALALIAALNHVLEQQGRGAQARLADRVNIPRSALNDILRGRRNGTEELREKLAQALGFTYEQMISLGRRIAAGEVLDDLSPTPIVIQQKISSACMEDVEEILDRDTGQELLNDLAYLSKNERNSFYQIASDIYRMVEKIKNPEKKQFKIGDGIGRQNEDEANG